MTFCRTSFGYKPRIRQFLPGEILTKLRVRYEGSLTEFKRSARQWTFSNVIAGSDSTAVVMRTTVFNLLMHPGSLAKLYSEFQEADRTHGLTRPYPKWTEVKDLPYLDACVNEAVRLHPPFSLPLERVAPKGGINIGDRYFPEGTCIGMNPYVVNRHRATFGEDVDAWRPERWLNSDPAVRKKMEDSIMTVSVSSFPKSRHS